MGPCGNILNNKYLTWYRWLCKQPDCKETGLILTSAAISKRLYSQIFYMFKQMLIVMKQFHILNILIFA